MVRASHFRPTAGLLPRPSLWSSWSGSWSAEPPSDLYGPSASKNTMTLSLYGLKEWLLATIIAAVLAAVAITIGWWWITIVVFVLWFAIIWFFEANFSCCLYGWLHSAFLTIIRSFAEMNVN